MAYPLRRHQLYNMVLLHPARADTEESWTSTGPRKYMDEFYSTWSPTVRKLLSRVEEQDIPEWTLRIHQPLDRWVEGAVALLGDACHPTLPYVAQGAAQAVEDAAVLAAVLAMTEKKENSEILFDQWHAHACSQVILTVHQSLLVYSEIRKARAEAVVASASKTKVCTRRSPRLSESLTVGYRPASISRTALNNKLATRRSPRPVVVKARIPICGATSPSRLGSGCVSI
jgi:salicylate hydroxylase